MTNLVRSSRLFPNFPKLFTDFFDSEEEIGNGWLSKVPAANVQESDNEFTVELAAPGLEKKDFHINVENGNLAISCEKKDESEVKEKGYTRKEFNYNSFYRSFVLPESVDQENIKASYKEGVLKLSLPKKEEARKTPKKQIEIK
ncbi:Hsp20/alpha crystallin family protein [Fulvivirgaceae bacterium BMA12]|uniref:Hsp20/alpha crystallin family protein n=1 Tax=Agaribacillus aureus TaxID=3051825 RepID=A0ABT8LHC0_9BACT|nr:Hsp20/alpha crystallin family protein [Fulvivirgaceae bacterium BMA12]